MELATKIEELGRATEEFKSEHKRELEEIKKSGKAAQDRIEKVEKINDAVSKLEEQIQGMKAAMNRTTTAGGEGASELEAKQAEYKKAFDRYVRKGVEFDAKAMSVDSDPDGGFLVTHEMAFEIVKKVFETSPMRAISSVQTISSDALEMLQDLEELDSGWVGETESRPETSTPQLKKIIIPAHEIYAQPKATQKLLDDASLNVEAWLSEKVSDKFARSENTAFVSGDGLNKPKGFLSYTAGTGFDQVEQYNSGSSGDFDADDLIELQGKLKEFYNAGAMWLMTRATMKKIRKFKGSDNQYLWQPGLNGGDAPTLLGKQLVIAQDMPEIAAASLSIAYGNFRAGYQIVDRIGIRVIRDQYTAKPHVLFYTTKRVGGGVKNFEAIKLMKLSA